jgi:hypothetical protein
MNSNTSKHEYRVDTDYVDLVNSMSLTEFVLFMGMFVGIILTNAILKIYLYLYKSNYPNKIISLFFSKTKRKNSR